MITQTPKTDFLRGKHDKYRMHPTYDGDTVAIAGTTIARIATGTYTGDGATSQAVSGVGFEPKWVRIFERSTSNGAGIWIGETTDTIVDDNAAGGSVSYEATWTAGGQFRDKGIIRLGTDGFTGDDDSAEGTPNKKHKGYS